MAPVDDGGRYKFRVWDNYGYVVVCYDRCRAHRDVDHIAGYPRYLDSVAHLDGSFDQDDEAADEIIRYVLEAEAYDGPSLIIAYSHCIAHGIDMSKGMEHQTNLVNSGLWPLYRFNPALAAEGKNPFKLDSKPPKQSVKDFITTETRFNMLFKSKPDEATRLMNMSQEHVNMRQKYYRQLEELYAAITVPEVEESATAASAE